MLLSYGTSQAELLYAAYGLRAVGGSSSLVYRSRELVDTTADDIDGLRALGIQTIIDLRKPKEYVKRPTVHEFGIDVVSYFFDLQDCPSRTNRTLNSCFPLSEEQPGERMKRMYAAMAVNIPKFGRVISDILRCQKGIVIHCANGKDRAGVLCALMMLSAGMTFGEIMDDYLLTNSANASVNQVDFNRISQGRTTHDIDVIRSLFEARPEYLKAFFAAGLDRYGSYDGILNDGLGLSSEERGQINDLLGCCSFR